MQLVLAVPTDYGFYSFTRSLLLFIYFTRIFTPKVLISSTLTLSLSRQQQQSETLPRSDTTTSQAGGTTGRIQETSQNQNSEHYGYGLINQALPSQITYIDVPKLFNP